MAITKVPASIVSDALWEARNWEESASITNCYSGRGMYGEECFGLDFHDRAAEDRFMDAIQEQDKGLHKTLRSARRYDSMGLYSIVYFPGFLIDEWEEED